LSGKLHGLRDNRRRSVVQATYSWTSWWYCKALGGRGSRCGGRSLLSAALLGGHLDVNHLLPLLMHPPRALCCWCLGGWCFLPFPCRCFGPHPARDPGGCLKAVIGYVGAPDISVLQQGTSRVSWRCRARGMVIMPS
jgi:hypothetical protein